MATISVLNIRCNTFIYSKTLLFVGAKFLKNYADAKTVIYKLKILWEKWGYDNQTENMIVCKLMSDECENICVGVHGSCVSIPGLKVVTAIEQC
jgi:hypothetical protein